MAVLLGDCTNDTLFLFESSVGDEFMDDERRDKFTQRLHVIELRELLVLALSNCHAALDL